MECGVVLVHGMWHGGWVWDDVRHRLAGAGIDSVAMDLPLTSLDDDVAATASAVAALGRPAVLVGHSYGGAVITAAGVHPAVRHLVYLAALQLDAGESVSRVLPERRLPDTRLRDALQIHGELVELDTELGAELMYHDAEPDAAAAAMARTRPVQRAVFRGMPASVAWHRVPSSYAVCGADRVLHPEMQRAMAKRATTSVEWSCGHSSPIVRPDDVVRLITDAVRLSSVQSG